MDRWIQMLSRGREVAPLITLALLLVLPMLLPDEYRASAEVDAKNAEVAAAVAAMPWTIGRWRGEPHPVPAQAHDILNPNALESRRYREIGTGREAIVVVVHCNDVRDMLGHYPPVCYPNAGWMNDLERREISQFPIAGEPAPVQRYEFYRFTDWGSERRLRIFNFFVLPNGAIAREFDELKRLAGRSRTSVLGIAQVQIVLTESAGEQDDEIVRDILGGLDELFVALGRKG